MARILLIDDDPNLLDMLAMAMEDAGHDVQTASDGLKGHKKASQGDPQLIVSDVNMPGLDGLQTMAALREIRADIPVILSSGYDAQSLGDAVHQANTSFVRKPYRPNDLWQVASAYL